MSQYDEFKAGDIIAHIGEPQKYLILKPFIGWYEVEVMGQKFNGHGLRMSIEHRIAERHYVKVGHSNVEIEA